MSYDFQIDNDKGDTSLYSLEVEVHSSIFKFIHGNKLDFPFVNRFSDYYSDAKFSEKELSSLIDEIESLESHFSCSGSTLAALKEIKKLASQALAKNGVLRGYCD
ncbi:MAG: hypothetical protein OQK04_15845 [Kangiellaceae bacterium]|nr:hypothetical protein [Kangiellaceae bacterium]MCW9000181.1 hypothetical protein [Kangiellaceae bacterium]